MRDMLKILPPLESLGSEGRQLADIFRLSRTVERFAPDLDGATADYKSIYGCDERGQVTFQAFITYKQRDRICEESLFGTRCHETVHIAQDWAAAAGHLDGDPLRGKMALMPYDFLLVTERMEQDAFAKSTWLETCAYPYPLAGLPGFDRGMRAKFREASRGTMRMDDVFRKLAFSILDVGMGATGSGMTLRSYYRQKSLEFYEQEIPKIKTLMKSEDFTFVRIDPDDIYDIGCSVGPCSFGRDGAVYPEFLALDLTAAEKEKLAYVEAMLGDDCPVMTLDAALDGQGMTRSDFLRNRCGIRERGFEGPPLP